MSKLDAEAQQVLGRLSIADIERYLIWRRTERRPGHVWTFSQGLVKLEVGQRWGYVAKEPLQLAPESDAILPLTVISTDPSGEVVFRPADPAMAERIFPVHEETFKGKPIQTRTCPFYWVEEKVTITPKGERVVRGSDGRNKPGDLTCHEAWSLWGRMHLHTVGLLVPDI